MNSFVTIPVLPPDQRTIPAMLAGHAPLGNGPWLCGRNWRVPVAEAHGRVHGMAQQLRGAGVGRGRRVCLLQRNTVSMALALLAVICAGGVAVPLDPKMPADTLGALVLRTGAPFVISADNAPDLPVPQVTVGSGGLFGLPAAGHPARGRITPDDPALVIFSSGSTGDPKGVILSHRALVVTAETTACNLEIVPGDVVATSNPLFHINAIAYGLLASLCAGVPFHLYEGFSASRLTGWLQRDRATILILAAAAIPMWWDRLASAPRPDLRLRRLLAGGAPQDIADGLRARIGCEIHTGFALSESPVGLLAPPPSQGKPKGAPCLGTPPRHPAPDVRFEAAVVGDDWTPLPDGEPGEIVLRGPAAMSGYLDDPRATASVLRDGWVRTGDMGRRDPDGSFWYIGRMKDLLRRNGEMFAPAEVEAVLRSHPDVSDAAVARTGDGPGTGEDMFAAFVEPRPESAPDVAELAGYCSTRLPAHKRPDRIVLCDSFPRSGLNKPLKAQLVAGLAPEMSESQT